MHLIPLLRFGPLAAIAIVAWGFQAGTLGDPMLWTPVVGLAMLPLAEGILEEETCPCGTPTRVKAIVDVPICPGCGD